MKAIGWIVIVLVIAALIGTVVWQLMSSIPDESPPQRITQEGADSSANTQSGEQLIDNSIISDEDNIELEDVV